MTEASRCACMSSGSTAPKTHIEVLPALRGAPVTQRLEAHERHERERAYSEVFPHLVGSERFEGGFRWTFRNVPGLERQLRELARREHASWDFLTFAVAVQGERLLWKTCGAAEAATTLEYFYHLPLTAQDLQRVAPAQ